MLYVIIAISLLVLLVLAGILRNYLRVRAASIPSTPSVHVDGEGFLTEQGVRKLVVGAIKPELLATEMVIGILNLGEDTGKQQRTWLARTPQFLFVFVDRLGRRKSPAHLQFFVICSPEQAPSFDIYSETGLVQFNDKVCSACDFKYATDLPGRLDEVSKVLEAADNLPRLLCLNPLFVAWGFEPIARESLGVCRYDKGRWADPEELRTYISALGVNASRVS